MTQMSTKQPGDGAKRSEVIGVVLGAAIVPIAAGLAIGLLGSWWMSRYMTSLVFGLCNPLSFAEVLCWTARNPAVSRQAGDSNVRQLEPHQRLARLDSCVARRSVGNISRWHISRWHWDISNES